MRPAKYMIYPKCVRKTRAAATQTFIPSDGTGSVWYNIYTMEFEFDAAKSQGNKSKYGIDFCDAQALWDDPDFVEVPATTTGERRFLVIGEISGKHWSAVITYRGNRIRIISVRRSREEEIKFYEI